MADVEENYDEEEAPQEESVADEPSYSAPKARPAPAYTEETDEDGLTETERIIAAKKKKFAEQEEVEIQEYLEQRAVEMQELAAEIEDLKARQIERRQERQEEMERMLEMQRANEEQRKQDEEERKAKVEADKRKKEADRKRKLQMMAGGGIVGLSTADGKANYVVNKKPGSEAAAGGLAELPPTQPGFSKEEAAAAKEAFLSRFQDVPDFENMDLSELRMRIKGMHENIARSEAAKYDMEERLKTQEYDLKELRERAKQQARQKAIKKGLDPEMYANQKHPPKKSIASKFDRQTDRRTYGDRREMFDKCLRIDGRPVIPPPKAIFHGSCKPPEDFGRPAARNEELEQLRKNLEAPKYQEAAPVEGAKPPVKAVPAGPVPEDDEVGDIPPQPRGELKAREELNVPDPEPAAAAEEEQAEEEEE